MTPKIKQTRALTTAPPNQNGFSLISNEKLIEIYAKMLRCRMIQERLGILLNQNKLNLSLDVSRGQEAATVGLTVDLLPEDTIAPNPSDIIPFFVSGLPLHDLLRGLFKPTIPARSIADQLKIATDAAMLNKLSNNKRISVAISSESSAPGPWLDALAFACLHDLPIIFLSLNRIPLKTARHSLPAITVDGTDVVALYRVACEAIAHARIGNGPTLIECRPYALNPGDPILNMEQYLTRKGVFGEEFKTKVEAAFTQEFQNALVLAPI
jgi:pyruvate dehydrogenase E1 component alpha subunit